VDRLMAFCRLAKISSAAVVDRLLAFQMLLLEHISTPAGISPVGEILDDCCHRLNAAVAA